MKVGSKRLAVVGLAVGVAFLFSELVYRGYLYSKSKEVRTGALATPDLFYRFDEKLGYRYAPNLDFIAYWWGEGPTLIRTNRVRTNNKGHVSVENDSVQKPLNEYRIAIVGDSLSACIHNEDPWPDVLQRELNRNAAFKRRVKKDKVNVINFSRDGVGLAQFPAIIEHEVQEYKPDLILVNFITADIYRHFIWRDSLESENKQFATVLACVSLPMSLANPECTFANNIAAYQNHFSQPNVRDVLTKITAVESARKPWFTFYPQLFDRLAPKMAERVLGRNPMRPKNSNIDDREESIDISARAIQEISSRYSNVAFLHLPTYWEIVGQAVPLLASQVMDRVEPIRVIPMVAAMPSNPTVAEVNRWTHFPSDMHFSDEGVKVYAKAVVRVLLDNPYGENIL